MEAFLVQSAQPTSLARRAEIAGLSSPPKQQLPAMPHDEGASSFDAGVVGCLAGLSIAIASKNARIRRRADENMSMVLTPAETYEALVVKGTNNSKMSNLKTLWAGFMGGCYVGLSGLLSVCIAGNLFAGQPTAQVVIFAALFPINLLLVLQSGAQLFTGNTANMSCAFYEQKIGFGKVLRNWVVSYIGNVLGCGTIALVAIYTHLLVAGTADMAIRVVIKKTSYTFGQTMVKAIMCNWLVCMAVYLATQAKDLTSKMVGIWFPISMFIMIGFEHSVANMFMLPAGIAAGAPVTVTQALMKNLLPVTIGNLIAGTVVIAAGFSFAFGKLGEGK